MWDSTTLCLVANAHAHIRRLQNSLNKDFALLDSSDSRYTPEAGLQVHQCFREFVEEEMLPAVSVRKTSFWPGLARIVADLTPTNRRLIEARDELQARIDRYHEAHAGTTGSQDDYIRFLRDIGYLEHEGPAFEIDTENVDAEIAATAGPQLVVPVSNARFALNAANARWVSLYDALYGSDVIDDNFGKQPGADYNPVRGAAVVRYVAAFLDDALPLAGGLHGDVIEYAVRTAHGRTTLFVRLADGTSTSLADEAQFRGFARDGDRLNLLFRNHGLHVEICVDETHPVGRDAANSVCDVVVESAISTIQDCEDSVAAVDAEDKCGVYRNWLGLMEGTLEAVLQKDGRQTTRRLAEDRDYEGTDGNPVRLPGRSLLLVRNVGHLMHTDAVLDANGDEVFEGLLDAVITVGCALNDIRGTNRLANSRTGSIYIVKPKMHGSKEAAFTDRLMAHVEDLYDLPRYTIKVGVMDEERRTSINLEECIRAVRNRLVFINTGFLDRTGDEIHTSMTAGPMMRKADIKHQSWLQAYEDRNVDVGLRCGLAGRAQIGKGMWPKTDEMREMVATKQGQLEAGASCAWVPSPNAAALHAMHYHRVDVAARQRELRTRDVAQVETMLVPPLTDAGLLSAADIETEIANNAQSILGYVVRWIDQGIGCSKVPDIEGVNLMEDRATLRISSQHIANWLHHGICSREQVREILLRMARVVDGQNADDPKYEPMGECPDENIAFRAACELVFDGAAQPNGYTEPVLNRYRRLRKSRAS